MNENPGDTPNPLNPNPEGDNNLVSEPDSTPNPAPEIPEVPEVPNPEPALEEVVAEVTETTTVETPNTDPIARPMEKAPAVEAKPVKKKKTGLIVGAIVCLFLAIGCGVAAALLFLMPKTDPVAAALNKLFSDNKPTTIAVKGNVDFTPASNEFPFSKLNLAINSSMMANSPINSTEATLTATMQNGSDQISLGFDEIYSDSGDLFFKLNGLSKAIEDLGTNQAILNDETECIIDESGNTICDSSSDVAQLTALAQAFTVFDNKWIRISETEFKTITDSIQQQQQNELSCFTNIINDAGTNKNSLAKLYQDNPFIVSSTENITVINKQNPIYRVKINDEKFTNFVEAFNNSDITNQLFTCLGAENAKIDTNNLTEALSKLPPIYVEIDGNNNFTRLYFSLDLKDGEECPTCPEGEICELRTCTEPESIGELTVDFEFSYPENINVSEPVEYQDFNTLMQPTQ